MQRYRYNSTLRKALLVDIEAARELMVKVGLEEGFTSHNTILISQLIDELLNELKKITSTD
ncbi:aspartyl-phosphate phosphatase Spo0E family protein [Priestia sp. Y58]|uniref:aspartyl-phosphate phosphatase Spo0E family protein n=1 Tax=Priestia TaxID=2800373 RepID=UPI001C8DE5E7|nr:MULTISPECIES: aspartyl-phosphate phosphatase Spo0E family protein [Priestia]MBX9987275.1 aspartyl-phosphate phosphatase Spo0E family protein [Priestia aryabhattai]MBX9998852.1 aspartyl-phosphate phosphatase Spo0E family protein [Priestia aryabhattai]MDG0032088.1 aspartyl-phosphate phosphatase Spo0E family protein [Priestia sp. Y58]MDG0060090.1 aspartyl-phosphate phosphatase Spo0E family protein [Priestia sp. P5]UYV54743.1 aspartyl-phosphate phosphatase Spo0E family protein [Priestia megater